jgi:hypothetical protein
MKLPTNPSNIASQNHIYNRTENRCLKRFVLARLGDTWVRLGSVLASQKPPKIDQKSIPKRGPTYLHLGVRLETPHGSEKPRKTLGKPIKKLQKKPVIGKEREARKRRTTRHYTGGYLEPSMSWSRPSRRVLGSSWKHLVLVGTHTASYAASRLTRASVGVLMLMRLGTFQDVPRYPQGPPKTPQDTP